MYDEMPQKEAISKRNIVWGVSLLLVFLMVFNIVTFFRIAQVFTYSGALLSLFPLNAPTQATNDANKNGLQLISDKKDFVTNGCYTAKTTLEQLYKGSLGPGESYIVHIPFCPSAKSQGLMVFTSVAGNVSLTAVSPSGTLYSAHKMDTSIGLS